jgi:thiol-disulfide isomerase/thioredoxin
MKKIELFLFCLVLVVVIGMYWLAVANPPASALISNPPHATDKQQIENLYSQILKLRLSELQSLDENTLLTEGTTKQLFLDFQPLIVKFVQETGEVDLTDIYANYEKHTLDWFSFVKESNPKIVQVTSIQELVVKPEEMVIKFYATWCGPCVKLDEVFKSSKEISALLLNKTYHNINIQSPRNDTERLWLQEVKPKLVPLVVKFEKKDGKWTEVSRFEGLKTEKEVIAFLK